MSGSGTQFFGNEGVEGGKPAVTTGELSSEIVPVFGRSSATGESLVEPTGLMTPEDADHRNQPTWQLPLVTSSLVDVCPNIPPVQQSRLPQSNLDDIADIIKRMSFVSPKIYGNDKSEDEKSLQLAITQVFHGLCLASGVDSGTVYSLDTSTGPLALKSLSMLIATDENFDVVTGTAKHIQIGDNWPIRLVSGFYDPDFYRGAYPETCRFIDSIKKQSPFICRGFRLVTLPALNELPFDLQQGTKLALTVYSPSTGEVVSRSVNPTIFLVCSEGSVQGVRQFIFICGKHGEHDWYPLSDAEIQTVRDRMGLVFAYAKSCINNFLRTFDDFYAQTGDLHRAYEQRLADLEAKVNQLVQRNS